MVAPCNTLDMGGSDSNSMQCQQTTSSPINWHLGSATECTPCILTRLVVSYKQLHKLNAVETIQHE